MGFEKIIGYLEIKKQFYQLLDQFNNPQKYKEMGARMIRGVLLAGLPGVGKSSMCRAFSEEAKTNSYEIIKDCAEEELIKKVTSTFEEAKKNAPSIILLEDVEKFSDTAGNEYDRNAEVYVVIQSAIDSLGDSNVLVLATANRVNSLPKSLLRSGRLEVIEVDVPELEDIQEILKYYLRGKKIADDINYDDLARLFCGGSVADVEDTIRQAAVDAAFNNEKTISMQRIVEAFMQKNHRNTNDAEHCSDDNIIAQAAYHEAGHLLTTLVLEDSNVGYAAIFPTKNSCEGCVSRLRISHSRPNNIIECLAGKVAVELYFPRVASGCSSDIEKACDYIRDGLGENATLGYGFIEPGCRSPYSETLLNRQEIVTESELNRYSCLCRDILIKNRDLLESIAASLLEKKILLYSEIQKMVSGYEIKNIEI